jgi:hypothetical protein
VVERGEKQVAVRNSEILESEAREFPFLPFLIFLFPFFLTEKKKLLGRAQAGQAQDPPLTITLFIHVFSVFHKR